MTVRLPEWFKQKMPDPAVMAGMNKLFIRLGLHTICHSALCPNIGICFGKHTATFLILGDVCTRNCTFCAVAKGEPLPVDENEPGNIARAVEYLGLRHVVVTSVTRDDLADGGASHFARVISTIKRQTEALVEVLVPDFKGSRISAEVVVSAHLDVFSHNVETVPRLYPAVRPRANFRRSVGLLKYAKQVEASVVTKSGLMVGLGETHSEILEVMQTLRDVSCDLLTIGQYLSPSPAHHPVVSFYTPEEFAELRETALGLGFRGVESAPLVRSSYNAAQLYNEALAP
jgi:lipoic acid synthetase